VLAARVGQRVSFADVAQSGRLVAELDPVGPAAGEMSAFALEVAGLVPRRSGRRNAVSRLVPAIQIPGSVPQS
jgi:hypothetical protein